jgi:dihydrofolate reductase
MSLWPLSAALDAATGRGSAGLLPGFFLAVPHPAVPAWKTRPLAPAISGEGTHTRQIAADERDKKGIAMRKLLSFHLISVDGYYEGPKQAFDWPVVDAEFNRFALRQLGEADTLVFGRVTYGLMAGYWPTTAAEEDDPAVTVKMNALDKIVISRTLDTAEWAPVQLIGDDAYDVLAKLKHQPGKNMLIMGSSALTVSLIGMGLVDEVRIMVSPIVLGGGKSLFRTAAKPISLTLLQADSFRSGNVLLRYRPAAR